MFKFKLIERPHAVLITPEVAKTWSEMTPFGRPFNPKRMEKHRKEMIAGQMRPPEWVYANCLETKTTYRVNGQHTSRLMASLSVEELKRLSLFATVSGYECQTISEVAQLYNTFDNGIATRSQRDFNKSITDTDEDLSKIAIRTIEALINGVAFALEILAKKPNELSGYERAKIQIEHKDFLLEATPHMVPINGKWVLHRRGVTAAMFVCWLADKTKNRKGEESYWKFWDEVTSGSNPDPNSASRNFQLFILSSKVPGSGVIASKKDFVSAEEMFVKSVKYANNWRINRLGKVTSKIVDTPTPL